jgi:hypothetical protein
MISPKIRFGRVEVTLPIRRTRPDMHPGKGISKSVLIAVLGTCIPMTFAAFFAVRKAEEISQTTSSAGTIDCRNVLRAFNKEDQKFLDDFVQQQDQENQRQTNLIAKAAQNVDRAEDDLDPAPRAGLIINTSEVKRAQLVVNKRIVKRAELVWEDSPLKRSSGGRKVVALPKKADRD